MRPNPGARDLSTNVGAASGRPLVALVLGGSLLLADMVFIAVNAQGLDATGIRGISPLLRIGSEWTLPEIAQYAKWALLAVATAAAYRYTGHAAYAVWSAAFAVACADDALSIHEQIGRLLARVISPEIRPGFFELIPMLAGVAIFLVALRQAHRARAHGAAARRYSAIALVLGAVYGFFAVGLDLLQVVLRGDATANPITEIQVGLIENSAELVVVDVMVGFTLVYLASRLRGGSG